MNVKALNIFVIMCGDRGYYGTRTGGSAFREDPVEFTIYRNYTNADKLIRREVKSLEKRIADLEAREDLNERMKHYLESNKEHLKEWKNAEVVRVVD